MTTGAVAVLALLLVLAGGDPDPRKEVLELVSNPFLGDEAREEMLGRLRWRPAPQLQRLLLPLVRDDATRAGAMELGARLRVPGLAEAARKHLDTWDEASALRLLVEVQDRTSTAILFDRWLRSPEGGGAFLSVHRAFLENDVADPDLLGRFEAVCSGPGTSAALKRAAEEVLRAQMGLPEAEREALLAAWKPFRAAFLRDAQPFPPAASGVDLLGAGAWEREGARRAGANWRLRPGGRLRLQRLPPCVQSGDFVLRVRILPDACEGVSVALREWKLAGGEGEWKVRSSLGTFAAPLRAGEWNEITFAVQDLSCKGGAREKRKILVSVDRKPLGERGSLDGVVEGIVIQAGKGGAVAGGLEIAPR